MNKVRRSRERRCERHGNGEAWLTFDPLNREDPLADGFEALEFIREERLPPRGEVRFHPPPEAEILLYVHEGALTYEDRLGHPVHLQAGEFQCLSGGRSRRERNASETHGAHIFRIQLRSPEAGRKYSCEQKRFSTAERRGRLCVVASPDGQHGSLRVRQKASVYSPLLDRGQHVVYELFPGRSAWLQVVKGEVRLGELTLAAGDGAGVECESAISFTALEDASVLLFDVAAAPAPGGRVRPAAQATRAMSGAGLFKILWDALADVLGPTATATLLKRSARRAGTRTPELASFDVPRVDGTFRYVLPRSFDGSAVGLVPLRELFDELKGPLVELTGRVVLRHFDRIPELREWAAAPVA